MIYLLNDHDVAALVAMYKPGTRFFLDEYDPHVIFDEEELSGRTYAYSIDLLPLILKYMKRYAMCSKNEKLVQAANNDDVEYFFKEIHENKEEDTNFYKFVFEYLIPIFEFFAGNESFEVTDEFIKNYLNKKVSKENLLSHISSIASCFPKDVFKISFTDEFMPSELYPIIDELFDKCEYRLFLKFTSACINGEYVRYEHYKNKLAIAEYYLREPYLLKEDKENSASYCLIILGEYTQVCERLKAKLGKYIRQVEPINDMPYTEPFRVIINFPNPRDYKSCVKFLSEHKAFFDELKAFKKGLFSLTLIKSITYYPQHELQDEVIDDELFKLGVKLRIEYYLGDR